MAMRDDVPTVCAVAILAMMAATAAHEAIGHGGACLLAGGRIERLTSVYFNCAPPSRWIAAAGPLGNLTCGAVAFAGLRLLPARGAWRLFAFLLAAFNLYWFAGSLVYAMALGTDDFFFAAQLWRDPLPPPARAAGVALGLTLYLLSGRLLSREIFGRDVRRLAWFAATAAAMLAALLFAPNRIGAAREALLEIGAASLPLLLFRGTKPDGTGIASSPAWIGVGMILFAAFAFTLGRGIG